MLSEKKYGGMGLISGKTEALYVELNKKAEAATCGYSAPGEDTIKVFHEFSFTDIS